MCVDESSDNEAEYILRTEDENEKQNQDDCYITEDESNITDEN